MKIRTSFVTNSSSYSSAEVIIDNPVLLEILRKYNQDLQKSGSNKFYCFDIKRGRKQLAVYINDLDEEETYIQFGPNSLDNVIYNILNIIKEDWPYYITKKDNKLLYDLKNELESRSQEIKDNYVTIKWMACNQSSGSESPEEGSEICWEFYYDRNGKDKFIEEDPPVDGRINYGYETLKDGSTAYWRIVYFEDDYEE